jgi:hypothetical protein
MLAGWRDPGHRLNALRIKLHEDTYEGLGALCIPAVDRLQNYEERPFENFAALDNDQYFWYAHAELPGHDSGAREAQNAASDEDDMPDLVRLVRSVDGLPEASRADLDEGGFSFYSICWPHRGSMIGFVSRMNPIATLKPGYRYFQFGNAMTSVRRPDFALKEGTDLVIGADGTAILSPFSFETLLGDVGVSFGHVKNDVISVKAALADTISLTSAAEEALLEEASRTRSNAKRLRLLPERLSVIRLNAESLRNSLSVHGIDPDLLLDEDDHFSFGRESVGIFFDAVEGRYFEDDLGSEKRRADRYSTRAS